MKQLLQLGGFASVVVLTACIGEGGRETNPALADGLATHAEPLIQTKHSMANDCYALQAVESAAYISNNGHDQYVADAQELADAEAFFMKPAMLGAQIFYATDRKTISLEGATVAADSQVSDNAIWYVEFDEESSHYSFKSYESGADLLVDGAGQLTTSAAGEGNTQFRLVRLNYDNCTEYPEMPLALSGQTFKGQGVDKPIIGFADVHAHISQGPSAGLFLDKKKPRDSGLPTWSGSIVHRLGVEHAMGDCSERHGPNGIRDGNNLIHATPLATHDTRGWPTFVDWPDLQTYTHNAGYYRWIERAYMAGLRVIVNYGTNINALCELASIYATDTNTDCNDHRFAMAQADYTRDIENYIDAQHGGPGKGWFRIVYSPQQAREVINDGKLAVILGMEASQLFDCGVTQLPAGIELPHCTAESFEAKLDEAYAAGIRQLVPLHDTDNAFAGGSILSDFLNVFNFLDTGAFAQMTDCPNGGVGDEYFFGSGGVSLTGVPLLGVDPVTGGLLDLLQPLGIVGGGLTPIYPQRATHCNKRGLTALGEHAYHKFFEKGMMVSIDHAPLLVKTTLLELAAQQTPPYPLMSGHGYQAGVTKNDVKDLLKAGGYSYPYKGNGAGFMHVLELTKAEYQRAYAEDPSHMVPFAMGYGSDINGFGGHSGPRDNPDELVQYPFQLFQGPGWGEQFSAAGIQPITVDQLSIPNGRAWDVEIDGQSHYGMFPDFVEEIRLEGGEEGITALYNSAESYIQLWEKVYKADQ